MIDNKMLTRIKNLFAKADSVEGTPEAETFRAKAFELLAKYGIEESMARGANGEVSGDTMRAAKFAYTDDTFGYEKMYLVFAVGRALHCSAVQLQGEHQLQLFGLARHMERVKFLVDLLMPQMLSGATKAVPNDPFAGGSLAAAKRAISQHRAEWMIGFAETVHQRLAESERNAAGEYDKASGGTGAELQLAADHERAMNAMRKKYPHLVTGKSRRMSRGEGYRAGAEAGSRADVGNTRVGAGRTAIG